MRGDCARQTWQITNVRIDSSVVGCFLSDGKVLHNVANDNNAKGVSSYGLID